MANRHNQKTTTMKTEPNNSDMSPDNVKIFHPADNVRKKRIYETQDWMGPDQSTNHAQKPCIICPKIGQVRNTLTSDHHFSLKHLALLFAPCTATGPSTNDVKFVGGKRGPFVEQAFASHRWRDCCSMPSMWIVFRCPLEADQQKISLHLRCWALFGPRLTRSS